VSEKKRNEKNKLTKYFFRAVTKSFSFLFPSNFTLAGGVVAVVAAVVDDACVGCRSQVPSD
jgi:hypothetical protein